MKQSKVFLVKLHPFDLPFLNQVFCMCASLAAAGRELPLECMESLPLLLQPPLTTFLMMMMILMPPHSDMVYIDID